MLKSERKSRIDNPEFRKINELFEKFNGYAEVFVRLKNSLGIKIITGDEFPSNEMFVELSAMESANDCWQIMKKREKRTI